MTATGVPAPRGTRPSSARSAGNAGAPHLDVSLPPDDEGAAEELPPTVLVDEERFTRDDRVIGGDALAEGERTVGWYAVTGLDARNVSRHKIPGRHLDQHAIADDPRGRHRERLEPGQSLLGLAFLVDAKAAVEEKDGSNADRLDRPSLRALPEPEAQIEGSERTAGCR
jgi:hypothetical protein